MIIHLMNLIENIDYDVQIKVVNSVPYIMSQFREGLIVSARKSTK